MRGLSFLNKLPGLLLAVAGGGSAWAELPPYSFPQPVTPIAHETLHVHNLFMVIALSLFFAVLALMLYSFWAHSKARGHKASSFVAPTSRKQWLWVLTPFVGLLILDYGVFGIPAYHAVLQYEDTKNNADLVVKVTGSQWLWEYEFPAEGVRFTSRLSTPREQIENTQAKNPNYLLEVDNPLVLPVGKKVRFITTSNDVIHSWWVPAFGVKRDAIPGFLREFWVKVDTAGTYRGQCSELCGKEHGYMPVVVHAVPEAEFKTWLAAKKAQASGGSGAPAAAWNMEQAMAQGEKVYASACAACHQPHGKGMPPAFPALDGSQIVNGPVDEHIKQVLFGKPNTAMAAFGASLSDADIAAVVTFERNHWGNKTGDVVQAEQVAKLKRVGQ
ncbi:MAG: cytochrome c oxidase subunit II [Rhodoferax sp.]|nr:cytochrome c oxidase subunit II [Rhodoferax sp.]